MRSTVTLAIIAAAMTLAGCEGENLFANAGVTLTSQPEIFEAEAFVVEDETGLVVDLIDEGALFELVLDDEEGTFESSFQHEDIDFEVAGTFEIEDRVIAFSDDPFAGDDITTRRVFEFEDADDVILLRDPDTVWDIDNDGVEEAVSLDIRLELID